ncbi:hypothetical protein GF361_04735 [Candidatus Woesearchaeota archaeon]|nr:hypothetical protein [Candidatus Woesearchaeota archaeon]
MDVIKKINKYPFLYWIPSLITIIVISYFSLMPQEIIISKQPGFNFNFMHLFAYLFLSFFMGISLFHSKLKNHYNLAILYCFLFGTLIEILQYFIPGRLFGIDDLIRNTIGIVLGQGARNILRKNKFLKKII